uniref:Uncharacterized protein n=1 Tax=Aegilops tauschii TaxID=37682 RepID=M8BRZ9_AEGTA
MAEAATAGATPPLPGPPDEITAWEILVRLDPKSLLRCRAVHRDYENEVWTLKCHIKLPVTEVRVQCESLDDDEYRDVVVVPGDGDLIVLVKLAEWLLQVDMDDKLVANFNSNNILFRMPSFQH